MDKQTIEKAAQELLDWRNKNDKMIVPRLEVHEAMKAILFMQGYPGATLERQIPEYHMKRTGRIDYMDDDSVIEVDDGPNIKSIRKLIYVKETQIIYPYWILLLQKGKRGKANRYAQKSKIPTLRIFIRNNCGSFDWI